MTKDEALKLALEALEEAHHKMEHYQDEKKREQAITAIKQALAAPVQEPVAWEQFYPDIGKPKLAYLPPTKSPENACYTTPPQRPWVGLTQNEAIELLPTDGWGVKSTLEFAKAIEAKLRSKNAP